MIDAPYPLYFRRLGPTSLIKHGQPGSKPRRRTLKQRDPRNPPRILKVRTNSQVRKNPPVFPNHAPRNRSSSTRATNSEVPPGPTSGILERLQITPGCRPEASAQASSKSTQSKAEIPFARQGIYVGSTLKSPTSKQGRPRATTLSSPKAASNN